MNAIPERTIMDIQNLAYKGDGVRAISRALGIAKCTVSKHIPRDALCACGKPSTHNGWCKARYAKSIARQAFHASRSGRVISLPPPIKLSRLKAKTKRANRWLRQDVMFIAHPVPFAEMFSIIGEVRSVCRTYPIEVREDVISEVTVRACEGYVYRSEIPLACKWFLGFQFRGAAETLSIDQILGGWGAA